MSKIGFWGTGNMAQAMMRGLIARNHDKANDLFCISKSGTSAEAFAAETGVTALSSPEDLEAQSDIIVLAFKPQQVVDIAGEFGAHIHSTIVSVLAGTSLAKLRKLFPKAQNIIRTMPNTPGKVGKGSTAYSPESALDDLLKQQVEELLGALGSVYLIEESLMDAFTGLAGSGPAYVFAFIEAMEKAATDAGIPATMAGQLAIETVWGAACLAHESEDSPTRLREQVTSPNGTTAAGLSVLRAQIDALVTNTVAAAKARSIEMAQQ